MIKIDSIKNLRLRCYLKSLSETEEQWKIDCSILADGVSVKKFSIQSRPRTVQIKYCPKVAYVKYKMM